jgi:hypothetical protein
MAFNIGSIFSPTGGLEALGDLGGFTETILGDPSPSGKGAQAAQAAENLATREFIKQQAEQARGDIFRLIPAAEEARRLGTQGALDIFGQTIPQQAQVFQQGNVGAQRALTQGLPQILAALRGTPVDISQFQPQTLQFDPSFAQQQVPQFQTTASLFPQGGGIFGRGSGAQGGGLNIRNALRGIT